MPQGEIPLALFAFNVGVELGQLAFVSTVLTLVRLVRLVPLGCRSGDRARLDMRSGQWLHSGCSLDLRLLRRAPDANMIVGTKSILDETDETLIGELISALIDYRRCETV